MTAIRLKVLRKKLGLTLETLAEKTAMTKSYLSKIERSRSRPSIAVAMKVAEALNVDGPYVLDILSSELSSPSVDYALLDPKAASKHGAYGMG